MLRRLFAAGLALAALPIASTSAASVDQAPACPQVAHVPDVGRACRTSDGLLEIFDEAGRSYGTTHGPDLLPPPAPVSAGPVDPVCADPILDPFHVRVVYARAHDDADRYAQEIAPIREAIRNALGILSQAADDTGASGATLKLRCDATGSILVEQAVLPTNKASANFQTIVTDMTALGYADPRAKHWVLYDDPGACTCGGQGHVSLDDSPTAGNRNNGNAPTPMFAVNFGYTWSARLWLHELGHNLGAVQNTAPHTSGALHCTDGRDTMCYSDGGPLAHQYTTSACSVEVFDCGKDDYFHLQPEPGSYLSRRWNVGSHVNRYLVVTGVPKITLLDPAPGAVYSGCPVATPGRPDPVRRSETQSAVVAGTFCARFEVDSPVTLVRVFVNGNLAATATQPVSSTGTATLWQLEGPAGAVRGSRSFLVEAVATDGYVSRTETTVIVV